MSVTLEKMAEPARSTSSDTGAPVRLAHSTYRDLRDEGLSDTDIMAFAGELLSLVAAGVRQAPDVDL